MWQIWVISICIAILFFYLGFKFGTSYSDGYIVLDKNENGDDRIVFQLNMEYDDIAAKDQIVFKVQKK